jgi:hypothetical protein
MDRRAVTREPAVPMSDLSIELGHFYAADLASGLDRLRILFQAVAPWARAARESAGGHATAPAVSTCILVDDYFASPSPPAEVIPALVSAAASTEVTLDYLVRESACVEADGVPLARFVEGLLVRPAGPGGWLAHGGPPARTHPLADDARRRPGNEHRHCILVDIEMWDEDGDGRTWSCAFLAAVWQLLRLGLMLDEGEAVTEPRDWHGELPDKWSALPPVLRLNPAAPPFPARRTMSIVPPRYLPVEHAVREILNRLPGTVPVPGGSRLADRVGYVFARPPGRPAARRS